MARSSRKVRSGVVVSCKMDKTAVVEVERTYQHPFYLKIIRSSKKIKVHDEKNECALGDLVEIVETRPISRDKKWRFVKKLGQGKLSLHELPKKRTKALKEAEAIDPAAQ